MARTSTTFKRGRAKTGGRKRGTPNKATAAAMALLDGDLENLHRGDDGSYIDAGEANEAGPSGNDGNRFSDRHYGGTNYLFQDFHAAWNTNLRKKLARDWDQNGTDDIDYAP